VRVALSTSGQDLDGPLDSRFGRAARFLVVDTETKAVEVVDNHCSLNAAQGAGIQAAETVARAEVQAVVTGHCGPKAFRVLSAAGIKVYLSTAATVRAALAELDAGRLSESTGADVQGHWA